MWSGETTNIPSGWFLCDGQNGTPDLRDKFVVGAGNTYKVGNTGGEVAHILTVNEMPTHSHLLNKSSIYTEIRWALDPGGSNPSGSPFFLGKNNDGGSRDGIYKAPLTANPNAISNAGNSQPHNNLPPYYALAYIMKA